MSNDVNLPHANASDVSLVAACGRIVYGDGWQRRMCVVLGIPESTMYRLAARADAADEQPGFKPPKALTQEQSERFLAWLRGDHELAMAQFHRRISMTAFVRGIFEVRVQEKDRG